MSVSTFVFSILAGVIPSFIWLWFWLHEDNLHPEPRTLVGGAFIGGIFAVLIAVIAEKFIGDIISDATLKYTLWAAVEELTKFIIVGFIALRSREYDEPIDAMIYCIAVALGFAALENMLFILSPISNGDIIQSVVTGNMRFIGATLVHVVSSATVGFAIGLAFYRDYSTKFFFLIAGLSSAIALHTAFNLSIINSDATATLKIFAWVWAAIVILIIMFEEIKAVRQREPVEVK